MIDSQFGLNLLQQGMGQQQASTQEVEQPQLMTYPGISNNYAQGTQYGIQPIQTMGASPYMTQPAISGQYAQPYVQTIQAPQAPQKNSVDMQRELELVKAMANQQRGQGDGIGKMVGQTGGGAVGAAIGGYVGGPQGAQMGQSIGGGAGGSIGALVDWYRENEAIEKAQKKELDIKRKMMKKAKRKAAADAIAERRANLRGIALTREQEALDKETLIANERELALSNLLNDLRKKAEYENFTKESFLKKRRMI